MVFDLIQKRRSVFPNQYGKREIKKETLNRILEAATWAPNHKKTEPWRFKVMLSLEEREKLGQFLANTYQELDPKPKSTKIKKLRENAVLSAAVVVICMQRDPKERVPEWEEIAATAMAVQNMWLCCTELGIGGYWSSPGLIKQMHKFFDFQEGEQCLGFFYMGYFDGEPKPSIRESIEAKTQWF